MTDQIQTIPSKDITFGTRIGAGGFGIVYRGDWHGYQIAIKTLKLQELDEKKETEFKRETRVMASLNHPGIVRLYGICTEPGNYAMLVEFMAKGDLNSLLKDKKQALPWNPMRWQLAIDIGAGLVYLHANKILHKDLKSHNILLDHNLKAKITDFGLSRIKETTGKTFTYSGGGTLPWMAPELFDREVIKTKAVDVYAYGVVLWEIASREEPWKDLGGQRIMIQIFQGNREEIPEDCPQDYAKVIQSCWKQKPEDRLSAFAALQALKKAKPQEKEQVPHKDTPVTPPVLTPEQIKKSLSEKSSFSFGSEEFQQIADRYAAELKDGKPSRLWNLETGDVVKTFGQHSETIFALCPVSTDTIATGSYDKTIKIWNLKTGQCVRTLEGHASGVYALAKLPNGHIVSASYDNTLRTWDSYTGPSQHS